MRIFHSPADLPEDARGAAVALGNFDGVHHGHRAVFDATRAAAKANGTIAGVVTFEPHPRTVLDKDAAPFRLTSWRGKAIALAEIGIDMVVFVPFDRAFSQQSPEAFVETVLVNSVHASHAVVGADFRFGKARRGTPDMLRRLGEGHGFGVTVVESVVEDGGEAYSSTRIRQHLREGHPREAAALLGRPWEIDGVVEPGDQRGRTIGFPTLNLKLGDYLQPALGVYAVEVGVEAGEEIVWHPGVANVGRRPTVDGRNMLLEAHLFDYSGDLYGRSIRVRMLDFLRPEQKFDGLDALKAQIASDSERARALLREDGRPARQVTENPIA